MATLILCVLTITVSLIAFQKPMVLDRLLFRPHDILIRRQYDRLLSPALIHAHFGHLALNMIAFYSFGRILESQCGTAFLLVVYGVSVLGGNLLSLWFHRKESYSALGASGGVCGIVYAYIFLFPDSSVGMIFLPIAIPGWLFAIGYMALTILGIRRRTDNIGHDAHLGGAILGLLVTTLYYPQIVTQSPLLYATVMIITLAFFYYFIHRPVLSDILSFNTFRSEYQASERYQRYDENREKMKARKELDQLLDKVSANGIQALSDRERKRIDELSKRL